MDFGSILKTVGSGLISTLVPGGSAIIAGINAFLPDDKKLPDNATGEQAQSAINTLSPHDKAIVLSKQFDVEITAIKEYTKVAMALGDVDKTGHSTRPTIAMMMACCVVFAIFVTISLFAYAIFKSDSKMIEAITGGWPFIVGVLSVPSSVILHYFGKRTKEKQQKYEAVTGISAPIGILASIFKK